MSMADFLRDGSDATFASDAPKTSNIKLNIAFLSFGSRGDLVPHLEIAKTLQRVYGHRVRFVTRPANRSVVEAAGVEFYSWGIMNPREMMLRRKLPRSEVRKQMPR
ncbi:hypothetical protein F4778DRAFT_267202 [Xylariomycetidae sp. FL2044]|nr:hypothetical protein F4778DRAFT_267202 [Xylariomycetidae sp. FL2044]